MVRTPSLGALGERQFRRYYIGQTTSYLGDGLLPVAISFAVLDLSGSASDLGLVLAVRMVPVVVQAGSLPYGKWVALFGEPKHPMRYVVDRRDRRVAAILKHTALG